MRFERYSEAAAHLKNKGLELNYINWDEREYWWFNDGTDSLLDHSATITQIARGVWYVSDFTNGSIPLTA
jgi:hypothetical protein